MAVRLIRSSSMTLPRRQRTTWSRLSQRWIRLYKTAPLLLATPPLPTPAAAATMPMPAMHVPVSSPYRRRSLPGLRILADKRVLSIRRHPRTDAQSHRNIARLHASHRRTARPRSHHLPVSPRSQPVVHTAVFMRYIPHGTAMHEPLCPNNENALLLQLLQLFQCL